MGWARRAPDLIGEPVPLVLGRWAMSAGGAMLAGVLLSLLHASEQGEPLQVLNIWGLSCIPLVVWVLAFSARAYFYGCALSHQQFLQEQAQNAQQAWQDWAHRYLAVHASCVLLPDQVSAALLSQRTLDFPLRTGQARRIDALAGKEDRAVAGMNLLFTTLIPALQALPQAQPLHVTLLCDATHGDALRAAWLERYAKQISHVRPSSVAVVASLQYGWIDDTLKAARSGFELILVLQVAGGERYSDGLAALLLCPDQLAVEWGVQVQAALYRPMPLDTTQLSNELAVFFKNQTMACDAQGLLVDRAAWTSLLGEVVVAGKAHETALQMDQRWIQEHLCGLAGPFSEWLLAALGTEMARHTQRSLMMLSQSESRHWISMVTTESLA